MWGILIFVPVDFHLLNVLWRRKVSREGRGCPFRSLFVARQLDLNVPYHLKEAVASTGGAGVMVAGSPLDDAPSEAVQSEVQTKRVAFSVAVLGADLAAGGLTVAAGSEHDSLLSPLSSSAAMRWKQGETTIPRTLLPGGLYCRWHRCAIVNISLDKMMGLRPPVSNWLEIRPLLKMLQAGNETAHQRLMAYLGGLAVLSGKIYSFPRSERSYTMIERRTCCREMTSVSLISCPHGRSFLRLVPFHCRATTRASSSRRVTHVVASGASS